ncbi:twin-arginine translocation pathway signal [Nocardia sp. NPDC052254]|uniref:twin-arginine translocation pathway signal n=1 Tax=Nocardia sp. NPDC052254 TaxID=3155681 RepID=UPI0034485FCE
MSTATESENRDATDDAAPTTDGAESCSAGTESTGTHSASTGRTRTALSWIRRHRAGLGIGAIGTLTVAAVATAASLYFTQYRTDQQTDDSAARAVGAAASNGSVAILSYAPESLDRDLTNAKSFLTGDFATYYGQFTDQVVAPAAKDKAVKTSAVVVRSAVQEMHPDSAVVLVFINQTTTTKDKPDPSMTSSSVKVSLREVGGKWLISAFDPV